MRTTPAVTVLTRTFGAHSRARARVRTSRPALAAAYAAVPGAGRSADTLPMLTISPPPGWVCMTAFAAWATKNGARRLSRTTAVTRFGEAVAAGTAGEPPALFTSRSSRPNRSTAVVTSAAASSGSRTSAAAKTTPAGRSAG